MNTELTLIISAIGIVFTIIAFAAGRISAARGDGKKDGTILSELGYLKSNTDEIKHRLDKQDERDREYISRLAAVEAAAKQAHKRLDIMEKRGVANEGN